MGKRGQYSTDHYRSRLKGLKLIIATGLLAACASKDSTPKSATEALNLTPFNELEQPDRVTAPPASAKDCERAVSGLRVGSVLVKEYSRTWGYDDKRFKIAIKSSEEGPSLAKGEFSFADDQLNRWIDLGYEEDFPNKPIFIPENVDELVIQVDDENLPYLKNNILEKNIMLHELNLVFYPLTREHPLRLHFDDQAALLLENDTLAFNLVFYSICN